MGKIHEWHSQRDVGSPNSEAEEGIDDVGTNDSPHGEDGDDVSVDDFMKAVTPDPDEQHDQMSKDLNLCGQHLAKTKLHQMLGNHEEAIKSLNRSMTHFQRFHSALKASMED